jgi:hypothetical protein
VALPRPHAAALRRVSRELTAAGVRHAVGGSGLLALLGLPVTVRDLDVEVEPGGATAVTSLPALQGFSVAVPYSTRGAMATTARGEIGGGTMVSGTLGGVPVEVFEHPGLRTGGQWHPLPLRSSGSTTLNGDEIPLADTGFWWGLYTLLDPRKAALLEPLVPDTERRRASAELGLAVR